MAESGKPAAGEVIHKTDMDGFVTGIISEQKDLDDNYVVRYYYQTASGDKYSFASSTSEPGSGYDDSFVTQIALRRGLNTKADWKSNSYTELGSFVASNGAHTVTNVADYRWLVFSMASVGMIGVMDRYLLRKVYNVDTNCFYITSDESWCALYMPSNTKVRIVSTNQSAATMKVYGVR